LIDASQGFVVKPINYVVGALLENSQETPGKRLFAACSTKLRLLGFQNALSSFPNVTSHLISKNGKPCFFKMPMALRYLRDVFCFWRYGSVY
jgi:hypothetical protein